MPDYPPSHTYFRVTSDSHAHIDNDIAMARTTAGTLAIYDKPVPAPRTQSRVPAAIIFRRFRQEDDKKGLQSAPLGSISQELRKQAEEASISRAKALDGQAEMLWLVRKIPRPDCVMNPELFLLVDRSPSVLNPSFNPPLSSKPTLHVCLSAPAVGALLRVTSSTNIPSIFLKPGDAILLHPNARMRLCAGQDAETVFLRFYSDHYQTFVPRAEPLLRLAPPRIGVMVDEEERAMQAKLDARRSATFAERNGASAAKAKEVKAKKEALEARVKAQEKEKRTVKEEKRRWDAIVAEEKKAWDAEQKRIEAEEKEVAELEEISRRNQEEIEALKRENGVGAGGAGAAASVVALRGATLASASTSTMVAGRKGKGKGKSDAEKIISLAWSQISVKAEPEAGHNSDCDLLTPYPTPSPLTPYPTPSPPPAEPAKKTRKRKASSVAISTPAPAEETAKSSRRARAY